MIETCMEEFDAISGRHRYQTPMLWWVDALIVCEEFERAEDYLDQCLLVAQERSSLYMPELATSVGACTPSSWASGR